VTRRLELLVGTMVLLLGVLVYVLDRPADAAPFFGPISVDHVFPGAFGPIGQSLPTFAHTFSFSVLTAVWFGGQRRICIAPCLAWFAIDTVLEVGQYPAVAERLVHFIPGWFDRLPILSQANGYFLAGIFDPWDLFSIAAGAISACLMTANTKRRSTCRE
jgi:hypothetical protein